MNILGVLPALADPESKFLVTPVIAWAACPQYTGAVNLAEVAAVHEVDLTHISAFLASATALGAHPHRPPRPAPQLGHLGVLTTTVLDTLSALLGQSDNLNSTPPA